MRELVSDEWEIFRDMRLHALLTEPKKFGCKESVEKNYTETDWRFWVSSSERQILGLFKHEKLLGITSVVKWTNDLFQITESTQWDQKTGKEYAFCGATYIVPDCRQYGLSYLMKLSLLEWISQHPNYVKAITAARVSNTVGRQSILRTGFTEINKRPFDWPDGVREDVVTYYMDMAEWPEKRQHLLKHVASHDKQNRIIYAAA